MTDVTISVTDDSQTCFDLRKAVFMDEQGFPVDLDEYDDMAVHLLAKAGEHPVGAARIVFDKYVAKIGRDVPGVTTAQLSAQVRAMGFYETLGFTATGPVYDDFGVPHQSMVQRL